MEARPAGLLRGLVGAVLLGLLAIPAGPAGAAVTPAARGGEHRVSVVLAMPLTAPDPGGGVLGRAALAALTAPQGELTRRLDAVLGTPVAIALDPMLPASIRLLGDTAPVTARIWLERLAAAPNEVVPLAYADADLGLLAEAVLANGGGSLPGPHGFAALAAVPADAAGWTPPATEELLAWNWTTAAVHWPRPGTTTAALLDLVGATPVIVGDEELVEWDPAPAGEPLPEDPADGTADLAGTGRHAKSRIGGHPVLVAPAGLADALGEASSDAAADGDAARSALVGALDEARGSGSGRTLLLALDRAVVPERVALQTTLDALEAAGIAHTTLSALLASRAAGSAELSAAVRSGPQSELVAAVLAAEPRLAQLAAALEEPGTVTDWERLRLLAYTGRWGGADPDAPGYAEALDAEQQHLERYQRGIALQPSSDLTLISSEAPLTLTVINHFPSPAHVSVMVTPWSDRLAIESPVTAVIPPQSKQTLQFPTTTRANGRDLLRVQLFADPAMAAEPALLDGPEVIRIDVQAQWDTVLLVLLITTVAGLGAVGVWRSIRSARGSASGAPERSPR